jgi:hypothetical protein
MVSFSNTEYKNAWKYGNEQQEKIRNWIEIHQLDDSMTIEKLDELLQKFQPLG